MPSASHNNQHKLKTRKTCIGLAHFSRRKKRRRIRILSLSLPLCESVLRWREEERFQIYTRSRRNCFLEREMLWRGSNASIHRHILLPLLLIIQPRYLMLPSILQISPSPSRKISLRSNPSASRWTACGAPSDPDPNAISGKGFNSKKASFFSFLFLFHFFPVVLDSLNR